jgi:hypothetical protein
MLLRCDVGFGMARLTGESLLRVVIMTKNDITEGVLHGNVSASDLGAQIEGIDENQHCDQRKYLFHGVILSAICHYE